MVHHYAGRSNGYYVHSPEKRSPGLVVYFFGASLYFANAVRFSEEVVRLVDDA
jgi:hypothetical protein